MSSDIGLFICLSRAGRTSRGHPALRTLGNSGKEGGSRELLGEETSFLSWLKQG